MELVGPKGYEHGYRYVGPGLPAWTANVRFRLLSSADAASFPARSLATWAMPGMPSLASTAARMAPPVRIPVPVDNDTALEIATDLVDRAIKRRGG